MKQFTAIRSVLVVVGALGALAAVAWAQASAPSPAKPDPVSVKVFENQLPVGYLGVPLGTVVRVTGEAFDGASTRRKADDGKLLLRIETVNGKALKPSVVFDFLRAPATLKKPSPGDKFDFYVHEYGEFDGVVTLPKELGIGDFDVAVANDGFYYRRHLKIHALGVSLK